MVVKTVLCALILMGGVQAQNAVSGKHTVVDKSNYYKTIATQGKRNVPDKSLFDVGKTVPSFDSFQLKTNSDFSNFGSDFPSLNTGQFGTEYSLNSFPQGVNSLGLEDTNNPLTSTINMPGFNSFPMESEPYHFNGFSNNFGVSIKPDTFNEFGTEFNSYKSGSLFEDNQEKSNIRFNGQSFLNSNTFKFGSGDARPLPVSSFGSKFPSSLDADDTSQFTSAFDGLKQFGLTTNGPFPRGQNLNGGTYNFRIQMLNSKPGNVDYIVRKQHGFGDGGFPNDDSFRVFERMPSVYRIENYGAKQVPHFSTSSRMVINKPYMLKIGHHFDDGSHKNIAIYIDDEPYKLQKRKFIKGSNRRLAERTRHFRKYV